MAVLDQNAAPRSVKERGVFCEVSLRAAAVKLDGIKSEHRESVYVAQVAIVRRAVIRADTVVSCELGHEMMRRMTVYHRHHRVYRDRGPEMPHETTYHTSRL